MTRPQYFPKRIPIIHNAGWNLHVREIQVCDVCLHPCLIFHQNWWTLWMLLNLWLDWIQLALCMPEGSIWPNHSRKHTTPRFRLYNTSQRILRCRQFSSWPQSRVPPLCGGKTNYYRKNRTCNTQVKLLFQSPMMWQQIFQQCQQVSYRGSKYFRKGKGRRATTHTIIQQE